MTPQELKNSILHLALRGKLTEQHDFEVVDWSLIATKKNSKMEDSEFGIPDNWCFSTLEGFCEIIPTKQYQILEKQVKLSGTYPVISQSKEYQIGFSDDQEKLYKVDTPIIAFGDHTTVVKYVDFDFVVGADGVKLFKPNSLVYFKYLFFALKLLTYGLEKIGGYSRHYKFIKNKPIPIPPLAEQKRIVAKIEELIPYIDRYEQAWSRLEAFNNRFPSDMQKSLLQMAIQGKLVEQRSEEGTAEELYQHIQAEKRRLVKEGKLKKEKPLPEIAEDEVPFEIPGSWKWVRLGDCSSYAQRKEKVSATAIKEDEWSLDLEDIEKETGRILQKCFASKRKIAGDKVRFYIGQILYSKLRPYLKKVLVAPDDGICSSEMVPFSVYGGINPQYIVYMLICPYADYVINSVTYGVKMPRVGTETMTNLLVPLPPLAEQKRIVAKLEELLPLCERLK